MDFVQLCVICDKPQICIPHKGSHGKGIFYRTGIILSEPGIYTLLIETGIIFALVTGLKWNAMGVKVFTSILVIFLNYFISKKFIFSIQYEKKNSGEMLSEDEVCREIVR